MINQRVEVNNSGISCPALILDLRNPKIKTAFKNSYSSLLDMTSHVLFFSIDQQEPMAKCLDELQ